MVKENLENEKTLDRNAKLYEEMKLRDDYIY